MAAKRIVAVISAALVALAAVGAVVYWRHTSLERFGDLADRVKAYYRLEQEKNWDKTWEFRIPLYRQSVPKEHYIADMQRSADGWELLSYSIEDVSEDGPCVLLTIRFVEKPPKGYFVRPGLPEISELTTTDESRWEKIDGTWQAWETGARTHMPLNRALLAPNQSSKGRPSTCAGRA